MKARLVRDAEALQALVPAWEALWRRLPDATPFQHPAWALAWWMELPKGELAAVAVEDGDGLLALLPGCLVEGELKPLGFDVSDYAEPLVARGALPALVEALPAPAVLTVRGDGGWPAGEALEAAPFVADPAAPLPAGIAKSLKEARRRLGKMAAAEIVAAVPSTAEAFVDALVDLHAARWSEKGEEGVLSHPAVAAFHRRAARGLAEAGLLRASLLRIGGAPAALFYGFCGRAALHYYLGGFDPAFRAASPGSLLIAGAMEAAARESLAFDFLMGREAYKYRWGAVDRGRQAVRLDPGAVRHGAPALSAAGTGPNLSLAGERGVT